MDLTDRLYDDSLFTAGELNIVKYMRENPDKVISMTIRELTEATYSSNPVIVRICKKLGLKGYREFKLEYAKCIESSKYVDRSVDFTKPFEKESGTVQIINNLSSLYKDGIDLVNSQIDIASLESAAAILKNSAHVFVYAQGDTGISAENFINKVLKLGIFFHYADTMDKQQYFAKHATEKDCCLFLTYEKADKFTAYLQAARRRKCKTITISSATDHPLARYCTQFISLPYNENTDKIATFYSQLAFTYILSILYSLIYREV